ncbi:PAS domain S-box protein [Pedobacter sp.]|uniref:PAS domain S-box protein n=1 Tax=Pedobacter sp. TaxID=1411316 RepID=UPI003D7F2500
MIEFPLTDWATRRIAALHHLEILYTAPEKEFDNIVALAAQICERPIATIGFMDIDATWFKAVKGMVIADNMDRNYQFNNWEDNRPIQIADTLLDPLSKTVHFSRTYPNVRSLTIAPLINEEGIVLGTLAVAAYQPGLLTAAQLSALEMLAMQTVSLLKLRLQVIKMRDVAIHTKRTMDQISQVFKSAIDAVIITDQNGVVSQWNPKAELMFGYSAAEACGKRIHNLVVPSRFHAEFFEKRRELFAQTRVMERNTSYELLGKRKDHTEFVISLGVSSVVIGGECLYICFAADITESKEVAKKLAVQKRFYENILNKIPMDIAVFDANHRYLYLNPYAIADPEMREYIIGKDDFEYAAYRKRNHTIPLLRREQFLKAKVTHRATVWEDQAVDPTGKVFTYIRQFFPVYTENNQLDFVIGYGVDITERKRLEMEQDVLVERLSFQNTQLFDFCNIVTHNLRGPLNNISMLVELIEDADDINEQNEMVAKLKPVIEGLKFTFNELVETIQIKQDLEIKSELVNLAQCLTTTLQGMEMEIMKANAEFIVDFSAAPEVCFPPKYIASIFHNLLSNALKYRSQKRQLLVQVKTWRKGDSTFLTFSDNGLGIDLDKHQDNVFKIGKVFHNHANAKGLGLYMTKCQVEVMGGNIELESEVDQGSTFKLEFKNQLKECLQEN